MNIKNIAVATVLTALVCASQAIAVPSKANPVVSGTKKAAAQKPTAATAKKVVVKVYVPVPVLNLDKPADLAGTQIILDGKQYRLGKDWKLTFADENHVNHHVVVTSEVQPAQYDELGMGFNWYGSSDTQPDRPANGASGDNGGSPVTTAPAGQVDAHK